MLVGLVYACIHIGTDEVVTHCQVKMGLGGNVRLIISGAAPLPTHVEEFLQVVTCAPVVQGYGIYTFFVCLFKHGIPLIMIGPTCLLECTWF